MEGGREEERNKPNSGRLCRSVGREGGIVCRRWYDTMGYGMGKEKEERQ